MIVLLAFGNPKYLRRALTVCTLNEHSVAALTMTIGAIYLLLASALLLFGLAQALGFFREPAPRRATEKLWLAASSLFWLVAGGSLLVLVLAGAVNHSAQSTLSSPYPEISLLVLSSAVLWLGYALYRLRHRRTP